MRLVIFIITFTYSYSVSEVVQFLAISQNGAIFVDIDEGLLAKERRTKQLNIALRREIVRVYDL